MHSTTTSYQNYISPKEVKEVDIKNIKSILKVDNKKYSPAKTGEPVNNKDNTNKPLLCNYERMGISYPIPGFVEK